MNCRAPACNEYETNLTYFISDVRTLTGNPQMAFIIGTWPGNAIVRQAEINVSQNVSRTGIFDTGDFPNDGSHYTSAGLVKMGSAFAPEMSKYKEAIMSEEQLP